MEDELFNQEHYIEYLNRQITLLENENVRLNKIIETNKELLEDE